MENIPDDVRAIAEYAERRLKIPREQTATLEEVGAQIERRMLPGETDLAKITRYETHLHRLHMQTAHELEALQERRNGHHPLLARVDMSGPPAG